MRKTVLATIALAVVAGTVIGAEAGLPKLAVKATYKVGFAQVSANETWRIAETKSIQDEAKKLGYQLVYTDGQSSAAKQVADVRSMIAQKVDAIFLAPREEKPLAPVVIEAREAGIPVFLLDRTVDTSIAKPGVDFVTFIGSDFIKEGQRVGQWLVKTMAGKTAKIIELEGTTGASAATDRKSGFDDAIKGAANLQLVASQSGDFNRDKGRQVAETLLQAHPDANVIFAANDDMAIGALSAIEAAGKKPGKDIIVMSIDGSRAGVQAIVDGKMNYIVECSPKFGPKAFATLKSYAKGDKIPAKLINPDREFTQANAKRLLNSAF